MSSANELERVMVGLPPDLADALRERIRETDGPELADMPLGILLRYIAAKAAGLTPANARNYARALPRGISKNETTFPIVADLLSA